MPWYYALGNRQAGPVDDDEFQRLCETGIIGRDTLLWREGMANWQPLHSIPELLPPPPLQTTQTKDKPDAATSGGACSECGRKLPPEQLLEFEGLQICADCKASFFSQLQEGVRARLGGMDYGAFKMRALAFLIDNAILQAAGAMLTTAASPFFGWTETSSDTKEAWLLSSILILAAFAINVFYNVWFVGRFGATPGKMALGLRIVTANGKRLTYWRAFFRFLAEYLSGCPTLYVGYLMAAWDDEAQTLHDRICNTRVIKKKK